MSKETYPYGVKMVQATQLWDADLNKRLDQMATTGSGIKIGVIDSGIFKNHKDLVGVAVSGYPGGDNSTRWDYDGDGHGTHVSGTLAASLNGAGVTGVSPGKVSLFMVRVFGNNGDWTYSSTLLDAANRCYAAGCKVINMSLGGASPSSTEDRGFASLYSKGVLSVAAAGNEGTTQVDYPAGYGSVISVGAIDSGKRLASFSQRNADVELVAPGVAVLSTVPFIETNSITVGTATYSGSHIEFSGRGTVSALLVDGGRAAAMNAAWSGKVVLVERGDNTFNEKVQNVQNSGGLACVIYNNIAGGFSGTLGEGNFSRIPAIALGQANGVTLKQSLGKTATVTSRKETNVSGYARYDGTSMAAPHATSVAAVIWCAAPGKSNVQVRNALDSSAEDLGTAGRDSSFGFGLVRALAARDYLLNR
ncbi:MAG: S8 family serine peptidase [Pyrinomonadaceae bacterium]|nr:S8 family serine peptidase [Pyrinomonadaceae bacterium]